MEFFHLYSAQVNIRLAYSIFYSGFEKVYFRGFDKFLRNQ